MIVKCPECGEWTAVFPRRRGYFQTIAKQFYKIGDPWHCDKCERRLTPLPLDAAITPAGGGQAVDAAQVKPGS